MRIIELKEAEKFPSVKTYSVEELADKHGVPTRQIWGQLHKGIQVELEHTTDPSVAKEIALDHIAEFPFYYNRLEKVEEDATTDFTGGPDTSRGKRLSKWLEKKKVPMAREIARFAHRTELAKDENWWLEQVTKEVLDGDEFSDLYQDHPAQWDTFVEAWNATPEYYANIVWSEIIHRYKKFAHYRRTETNEVGGVGTITAQNSTPDVKAGETGRQANKFNLKVDSKGTPKLLRP